MEIKLITSFDTPTFLEVSKYTDFLHKNLEAYAADKETIGKALDYALSSYPHQGGFVLLAEEANELAGILVLNQTGMEDYVPENLIVYVAAHQEREEEAVCRTLLEHALRHAKGSIAMHLPQNHPAMALYESMGFASEFVELRLKR